MRECQLSAIVVAGPRFDDVRSLFLDYWGALSGLDVDFELIYVIDGPRPKMLEELRQLQNEGHEFRIIELARAFGEATALTCGFEQANGRLILTLPAYYQVDSSEIRKLFDELAGVDMVIAQRWPRRGSSFEALRRRAFHGLLRWISGYRFHDLGCGVRLFRHCVMEELRIYGDQHRFLPMLAKANGFRVTETNVAQSERDAFHGRYRWREYLHRILDILTVFFVVRFTKKPLRFFGMIGSALLAAGSIVLLVIVIQRLFMGIGLADRPVLLLSSLLVVLGLQVISLGLLGELIIFTHAPSLKEYKISEIIESEAQSKKSPADATSEGGTRLPAAANE